MDVRVGDARVHVSVRGETGAEALLLLHGLSDSISYYRRVVDRLSERYRVVALDFRGHGRSDRAQRYATPDFVADAVAACEQAAGPGCVVIAHSFGGLIGAALAQQRPDLLRGLFLEDPLLADPAVRTDLLGDDGVMVRDVFEAARGYFDVIAAWQRDGVPAEQAAADFARRTSARGTPNSEELIPAEIPGLVEGKLRFDLRVLDDFAAGRASREAAPVFDPARPIEVPGFMLAGDPSVPGVRARPVDVERLRATSPAVEHETVPGAGHFIHLGPASERSYMGALDAFLSRLEGRP